MSSLKLKKKKKRNYTIVYKINFVYTKYFINNSRDTYSFHKTIID